METLFELPEPNKTHPARYTPALLVEMAKMLDGCTRVLDPFGGTGGIFLLEHWMPNTEFTAVEIEPEWAKLHPKTELGNALYLRFGDDSFDGICTSPAHGNRMADHDKGTIDAGPGNRNTYASHMGRMLHEDNGGLLQWGDKYREFHRRAWAEATRVLDPGGKFVLNIKDHIRGGEVQHVTDWHIETIVGLEYDMIEHVHVETPSLRYGQNSDLRVGYESLILFRKHGGEDE